MSTKIIGVTVGTPTSPTAMAEKLKPVTSINGKTPDENGNVDIAVGSGSGQNGNGMSGTASALLIAILRNGVYNTDQSAKITALEAALGSSGNGDSGGSGDNGDDSGNTEPSEPDEPGGITDGLITSGLLGFWDMRTAPERTDYDWYYSYAPNSGSGLYANITGGTQGSVTPEFTEYGSKNAFGIVSAPEVYPSADNNVALGTEFTLVTLTHAAPCADGGKGYNGIVGSNIDPRWRFVATYNTATGTAETGDKGSGNNDSSADYNFHVKRVNANEMKVIMNTSSFVYDGSDYDGFVSWYDKLYIGTLYGKGTMVAFAVYNRALSDVEIEEMRAFFKTLEVTA